MAAAARRMEPDATEALPPVARPISDLVWDGGLHGTVFVDNGSPLTAGADVGWTPEALVATAAGAVLMTTILRLAAGASIEIVGYVSAQRVAGPAVNGCPSLRVSPCISVRTDAAAEALLPLLAQAIAIARGSDATSCNLTVEPQVTVVPAIRPRW